MIDKKISLGSILTIASVIIGAAVSYGINSNKVENINLEQAKTVKKVNNAINKAFSSLDIHSSRVEQCTDEAIVNMRIIKIECN